MRRDNANLEVLRQREAGPRQHYGCLAQLLSSCRRRRRLRAVRPGCDNNKLCVCCLFMALAKIRRTDHAAAAD